MSASDCASHRSGRQDEPSLDAELPVVSVTVGSERAWPVSVVWSLVSEITVVLLGTLAVTRDTTREIPDATGAASLLRSRANHTSEVTNVSSFSLTETWKTIAPQAARPTVRRTKIVCTLGPDAYERRFLRVGWRAGALAAAATLVAALTAALSAEARPSELYPLRFVLSTHTIDNGRVAYVVTIRNPSSRAYGARAHLYAAPSATSDGFIPVTFSRHAKRVGQEYLVVIPRIRPHASIAFRLEFDERPSWCLGASLDAVRNQHVVISSDWMLDCFEEA